MNATKPGNAGLREQRITTVERAPALVKITGPGDLHGRPTGRWS